MFLILCTLGTWQISRFHQKEKLLSDLDHSLNASAIPLTPQLHPAQFTKVVATGQFGDIPPLLLKSKPFEGKIGQYVISPFLTDQNQWVLVLRGWAEYDSSPPTQDKTTIYGQIRYAGSSQWFEPDNSPQGWVRIDPIRMGHALGMSFAPYYILEESPPAPIQALPQQPTISNNHLSYIITWFGLAFALLVMVFIYIRKDQANGRKNNYPR